MRNSKKSLREVLDKKQLMKWKKKKKEEVVNLKKEKKIAQKGMKKKFGKEVKSKKVKVKAEEKIGNPVENVQWYHLYNLCMDFDNSYITSGMMYGSLWDATMRMACKVRI